MVNELKPLDPEKIIQIREKSTIGESISSNNQELIRLYEGIIADYKELLELLSEVDKNDRSDDFFKLATILLRPSQDIEKLLYYLFHKDVEINIELLDNPKRSHAEVNLAKEFSHNKDLYIGVSKLCCGFCDYLLDDIHHIKHRVRMEHVMMVG